MRERLRILFVVYGLLLAAIYSEALKPTRKFKIATTSTLNPISTTATDEPEPEEPEVTTVSTDVNATTGHTLTGIPQIDYIWDPNLPRELNGFNLSSYPFYSTVPVEEINFKCDGLHDGFYASIEHKCQVYHHCLYGTRYDFLCANFTAFDQKTFICHFASEVDCANSKKYWHRNDALYQATTTTTTSTTTTTTLPPPTVAAPAALPPVRPSMRRRPFRRRPAYDYYDDEYYDDEYVRPERVRPRGYDRRDSYEYDDRAYGTDRDRERDYRDQTRDRGVRHRDRDSPKAYGPALYDDRDREKIPAARPNRRDPVLRGRPVDQFDEDPRPSSRDKVRDSDAAIYPERKNPVDDRRKDSTDFRTQDSDDQRYRNDYDDKQDPLPVSKGGNDGLVKPAAPVSSVYARPRAPPKIRRPVPVSEQNKYAYNTSAAGGAPAASSGEDRRRPDPVNDDYLDDDLEETRPRRPIRRRPAYDLRERSRDRERNYRTRYQDEGEKEAAEEEVEEEVRIRKRPDRQRERFYDRGERPYVYERERPAITEKPITRYSGARAERPGANIQPSSREEEDFVPPRSQKSSNREREPPLTESEPATVKRVNFYKERAVKLSAKPEEPSTIKYDGDFDEMEEETRARDSLPDKIDGVEKLTDPREITRPKQPTLRPATSGARGSHKYEDANLRSLVTADDYTYESSSEYYDEPEEAPVSSPRPSLRVVKRPFLPSRGGNPNPRGLKQVGLRVEPRAEEPERRDAVRPSRVNVEKEEEEDEEERDAYVRRQPYDAYRTIQTDGRQQQEDSNDGGFSARPQTRRLQKEDSVSDQRESSADDSPSEERRSVVDTKSGDDTAGNRLLDIPESEYDVALNEALTPSLIPEVNSPGGFILPIQRQTLPQDRDANLQSSQRKYLFARPAEPLAQPKITSSVGSLSPNSYPVSPTPLERSGENFQPRHKIESIFPPENPRTPWQGYVEY